MTSTEAAGDLRCDDRDLLPREAKSKKNVSINNETSASPGGHVYSTLRTPNGTVLRRCHFRLGDFKSHKKRCVLKNGTCNVIISHVRRRNFTFFLGDMFTTLVESKWRWTLLIFSMSFIASWMAFALLWWLICHTHGDFEPFHLPDKQEQFKWTPCVYNLYDFRSCFLFSIETQTTIGYGVRTTTEECPEAIFLMCLQSIFGVITQAFMVGVAFAKMAHKGNRSQIFLFSKFAVISQREGNLCLMLRMADIRKSRITNVSIRAVLLRSRISAEGEKLEEFQDELKLQIDESSSTGIFLMWPAVLFHRIDSSSPLYSLTPGTLMRDRFEIVIIIEATIESTGLTIQTRTSFLNSEILWGHRFDSILFYNREFQCYDVDYSRFNETFEVETPLCSAEEIDEFLNLSPSAERDQLLCAQRRTPANQSVSSHRRSHSAGYQVGSNCLSALSGDYQ
ncbi:G protein-activated inward rectifier potassium channel 3-like [Phlebotomus argentipes]|uniref:G protein-activated inward rectifier potassium channel 3-like n=1 Tax=Phlebotomus argentipes TaxID=94469 RepID=UPI002893628D|nr:G protein-activated inward rectifier potassium channel 3-like [Phlebotomus argentipes]